MRIPMYIIECYNSRGEYMFNMSAFDFETANLRIDRALNDYSSSGIDIKLIHDTGDSAKVIARFSQGIPSPIG